MSPASPAVAEQAAVGDAELLKRALWICGQVPRLHEISEHMGATSDISDAGSIADIVIAQTIIEAANRLQVDLCARVGALDPPARQTVLQYRKPPHV